MEVEWELLPWLCDVASEVMDVLFGLGVSTQTLIDNGLWGASLRRLKLVKGALHEGMQDIGWGECHGLIVCASVMVAEELNED